jgi:thiol-disulfide isomerase/thioredoxin
MNSRFPAAALVSAFLTTMLLAGCARERISADLPENLAEVVSVTAREDLAPGFSWKGSDGREVRFDDVRGAVTLVNFWATWCGPCKAELPELVGLSRRYADRGFRIIGVATDRTPNAASLVAEYMGRYDIPYQVVLSTQEVERAFGNVRQMPTSLLIDGEGRIVRTMIGMHTKADFEKAIEALL